MMQILFFLFWIEIFAREWSSERRREKGRKWKWENKFEKLKSSRCSGLTQMDFWSNGHTVQSCSNADNFKIRFLECRQYPYFELFDHIKIETKKVLKNLKTRFW